MRTQDALDRQRVLATRETLTPQEEKELGSVREDLRGRGFDFTIRDPLYQEFLRAWTAQEDPAWRATVELTPNSVRTGESWRRVLWKNSVGKRVSPEAMRFIDLEAVLPKIRNRLADLQRAQAAVLAEPDAAARANIIEANQPSWTALRQAFEEVSAQKCWYTECKSPGADNDIDHFRPKGRVKEDVAHPGYYWLAFDWKNFRLSCQRANRPRIAPGAALAGGKSTHFPLLSTGVRARTPVDDLSLEHPALLDPTEPGDPIILTFRPNGEIDVSPQFKGSPVAEAKVEASRLGLHLNWPKFVEGRLTLYNRVERAVERGRREAPVDFNGFPTASAAFKDVIRDLRSAMDPRAEYSAAARVYVESFRDI